MQGNSDRYSVIGPGGRRTQDGFPRASNNNPVVSRQPVFGQVVKSYTWAALGDRIPGVPEGLEVMVPLDRIDIIQTIDWDEMMTGFEKENRYRVLNGDHDQIFLALENSSIKERMCGGRRAMRLKVINSENKEVIRMSKDLECCFCCKSYDLDNDKSGGCFVIEAPPDQVVGYVKMTDNGICTSPRLCTPAHYQMMEATKKTLLHMYSPSCVCDCPCSDVGFKIIAEEDKQEIGLFKKKGSVLDTYGDADEFRCWFPAELDVMKKVLILGTMFLVDYLHFEKAKNQ